MSNLSEISEPYCAIANLQNYILCAYPNFLVLGKPLKTNTGVKYEKKTYFKIRSTDFETWFSNLKCAFDWFSSNEIDVEILTFLKLENVKYSLNYVVVNEKKVLTIEKNERDDELIFHFDLSELKMLMSAFADLIMHTFCLEDNVLRIFYLILNHFLCLNWTIEKVSKKIANLKYSDVFSLCQITCNTNQIEGSLFLFTEYLLKHKLHLLIIYHLKQTCILPVPNLIQKYQQ